MTQMRERLIAQLRETGKYIAESCGKDRYGLEREVARLSARTAKKERPDGGNHPRRGETVTP